MGCCIGAPGYIILIASRSPALSYFGVYLAVCGIYPNIPNTIAWVSNNVEGTYKRSVTLAMVISFGNINGAVSSNVISQHRRQRYDHVLTDFGTVVSGSGQALVHPGTWHRPDIHWDRVHLLGLIPVPPPK